MFVTEFEGNVYKVKFRYIKSRRKQRVPDTICNLLIQKPTITFDDGSREFETLSFEHKVGFWHEDEPDKNLGRKYAMTALFKEVLPGEENKALRTHLWNTYWEHRGNKGY